MTALINCRRTGVALSAALVLLLSGCGSRLSDQEVLAQNTGPTGGGTSITALATDTQGNAAGAALPGAPAGGTASTGTGVDISAGARGSKPQGSSGSDPSLISTQPKPGSKSPSVNAPEAGSVVNVGQIGLFSGVFGELLRGAKIGSQVAVAYINAHGGLNGHPINLISGDDGGDPATSLAIAQKMIDQDKVIAFINMVTPTTSGAVFPAIQKRGVPILGGIGAEPEYYTAPLSFPGAAAPRVQSISAIKYGIEQGHTKVGMLYCAEVNLLCSANAEHVRRDTPGIGGDVVFLRQVSMAQPDFTSQCLAAKSAGVTNLLLGLDPSSIVRVMENCAGQNYHPQFAMLGLIFSDTLLKTKATDGLIVASPAFPFPLRSAPTQAFYEHFEQTVGTAPSNNLQAAAWLGGLILQAGGKGLPANPTAADLVAGLTKIKANAFGGLASAPVTFTSGKAPGSPTCAFMLKIVDGTAQAPNGLKPTCLPAAFSTP